jgi:glycosyltransferase involved in cell wall biosynthesis
MVALRRLFFAQPGLVDRHSHYYGEALGWQAVCRARGIAARFYVHEAAAPEVRAELGAAPVFSYTSDAILGAQPDADCRTIAKSFAASYDAFARDGIGGDDIVVVPFALERDLFAAALFLSALEVAQRPSFAFIFHIPDIAWTIDAAGDNITGRFSRWQEAMRQLEAVLPPEKILFSATTVKLADALTAMLDHPCIAGPLPTFYLDDAVLAPIAARLPRVNVRMAGDVRLERGAELVTEVMLCVAAQRPGTSFALQLAREDQAHAAAKALAPLAAHRAHCYIDYGLQGHPDYQARLKQSDVVLLPYRHERYILRASGVFSEAVAFGLVTVVPAGTSMAVELANGWGAGVVFREWRAEGIAAAVVTALDNYPVLAARAAIRVAEWRQRNCAAAMLDILAQLAK